MTSRRILTDAEQRARKLHDVDGVEGRREPPLGAAASFGIEWASVIENLSGVISDSCPEVMKATTRWILRAQHKEVLAAEFLGRLEQPGIWVTWAASWGPILKHLNKPIIEACPEALHRGGVYSIVRARNNGFRIEFFHDEMLFKARVADRAADMIDGAKIGKAMIVIEFFKEQPDLIKRLGELKDEIGDLMQPHAGTLTWV